MKREEIVVLICTILALMAGVVLANGLIGLLRWLGANMITLRDMMGFYFVGALFGGSTGFLAGNILAELFKRGKN